MDEQKQNKIADLLESGALDEMLENAETDEDIQKAFAGKGVNLSLDEVDEFCGIFVQVVKEREELSPEQLDEISGGVVKVIVEGVKLGEQINKTLGRETINWDNARWLVNRRINKILRR